MPRDRRARRARLAPGRRRDGGRLTTHGDAPVGPGRGRVLAGTSGFSYAGWAPRFYPAGARSRDLLPHYASRLAACELNNTFYARPTVEKIAGWCAATPPAFRFVVKAQRGASIRALYADPVTAVPWLTETLPAFGERLGAVLFRVPGEVKRQDDRLAGLLAAWPPALPLVLEAQHESWHVDETFAAMRAVNAVLCTTDLDELETPPDIRRTGPFLYLRLRRTAYDDAALDAWAQRIAPFVDDGVDAYVLFRHDEDGTSAIHAVEFGERVERARAAG